MEDNKMKKLFVFVFLAAIFLFTVKLPANAQAKAPEVAKNNYILIFWGSEYTPKMGDAVEFFFKNMLRPNDVLSILTPLKPVSFPPATRQKYPVDALIDKTEKVLKNDLAQGGTSYRTILEQMVQIIIDLGGGESGEAPTNLTASSGPGNISVKNHLNNYLRLRQEIINQRKISEKLFLDLAGFFKQQQGKNYLFIFFEKEIHYIPNRSLMDSLRQNAEIRFNVTDAFESENTKDILDAEKVITAFKDAGVTVNFIYMQMKERRRSGMELREHSNDVYGVLSKIANATGGEVVTTSKPEAALKDAAKKMGL